ncbi:hypothetical protein ASPVEDRAFT_24536 [Aspergillus versicolor CBS 583.65]|uniref:Zn(2)-C6 fungal-type domain-containing protein n=1 Tax=Aspergillus versicolor CBS 583.65 TaxID=1036611 RepID=A0A1L9P815_ASPVE|nr:uncharacterized protein ASPVEDRAFT_24536 [Aspergillus versicolor CBS 583.65]OJI97593.1 hypothetical protein ASPVEDRAFT_24536 [Aspergillus versicolor CBS 583.65]
MDGAPRLARSRRPRRVKTFTGCMTCRTRHLKCDETRPGCRRCADAQLDCSGYPGYRAAVQWKEVRGLSDFGISQTEPAASAPNTSLTWHHAQCSPTPSQDGSVASDPPHHPQDQPASTHGSPQIPMGQSQSVSPAHYNFPPEPCPSRLPLGPQDVPDSVDPAQEDNTTTCPVPRPVESPVSPSLSPRFHGAERHIDLAPSSHLQRRCIEHWVNHLSDALSSVPGSMNPLKRFFMPIALVGAMSSASSSTGSAALFYLICSASAFHLSGRIADSQESARYMTLGLSHQNRGIRHLQHNLVKDDPDERESVLASLLMCLTYEPVTVERDFWLTHLRGASQWLQKTDIASWAHNESTVVMYQMLAGTATMLRSQIASESVAHDDNFHFRLDTMSEPYHLHHIFGLPKVCLNSISNMIGMAVRSRQQNLLITVDLDQLETELYLSIPPECKVPAATRGQDELVHHYSHLFYLGSIIYCKRRLRAAPLSDVQPLVEQACDHIEALANYRSRQYSPILWPVAVAVFEAQDIGLRTRILQWVDIIIEQSTLSIWQKFKPLLCSLWETRRVPGQEEVQWDDFLGDPSTPSIMIV